jgi:hypothetical protein
MEKETIPEERQSICNQIVGHYAKTVAEGSLYPIAMIIEDPKGKIAIISTLEPEKLAGVLTKILISLIMEYKLAPPSSEIPKMPMKFPTKES